MTTTSLPSVEAAARDVAAALIDSHTELGERIWNSIVTAHPELLQRPGTPVMLAHAASHATNATLLHALASSARIEDVLPATEVVLATRALAQSGYSEDAVMSGYRLGIAVWCENWADAVEEHCPDPQLAVKVARHGTSFVLAWLETISGQVVADYRQEVDLLNRKGALARMRAVSLVLAGEHLDPAVGRDLRYDLGTTHVALVVTRSPGARLSAPVDQLARELVSGIGASSTALVVREDGDTALCWIPLAHAPVLEALDAPVLIGQGRPARGPDGFRLSHREAREAVRVARFEGRRPGAVTPFADVEIIALCTVDEAFSHTFVRRTLGALLADTDEAVRLRSTLESFFATHCNYRATAAVLGIHHNTVRYRLERIQTLLGRAPDEDRLALELALHLASSLGLTPGTTRPSPSRAPRPQLTPA